MMSGHSALSGLYRRENQRHGSVNKRTTTRYGYCKVVNLNQNDRSERRKEKQLVNQLISLLINVI